MSQHHTVCCTHTGTTLSCPLPLPQPLAPRVAATCADNRNGFRTYCATNKEVSPPHDRPIWAYLTASAVAFCIERRRACLTPLSTNHRRFKRLLRRDDEKLNFTHTSQHVPLLASHNENMGGDKLRHPPSKSLGATD